MQAVIGWIKENPLKISGILWAIGEIFAALAGEFNLHNFVLIVAAILGIIASVTLIIWGHGAKKDAERLTTQNSKNFMKAVFNLRTLKKGFYPWRWPVESVSLMTLLSGIAYAASGMEQWRQNHLGLAEMTLLSAGIIFIAGSLYAYFIPDRPGHVTSMTKSALLYVTGNIGLAFAAWSTQSIYLGLATFTFIVSNIPWALSYRHDNKMRRRQAS